MTTTLDDLELVLKELSASDVKAMSDIELDSVVMRAPKLRAMLEALEVSVGAEWNQRRLWAESGARSGAASIARHTGEDKRVCGTRLWLGRKLAEMPLVAVAYAAGDISANHVSKLASVHKRRTAVLFSRDEAMLVDQARELRFDDFTRAVDYWMLHADPDGVDADYAEQRDRRRVSLDQTITAMWSGTIVVDPISGTIVRDELDRLEQALFEADWAEARQRLGREPHAGDLARTPDQRRADALVEMACRSRTAPADGKAPKPLFTVLLGAPAFAQLCQLDSGQVVPPGALRPWLTDAEVERILFDGGPERPIKVSRKRRFSGAARRIVEVVHRRCFDESCDEPASRCEADHVQPWSEGGMTSVANGRMACGKHNRAAWNNRRRPPPDDDEA